jgi:CRP-like cAMP-binding protein
MRTDVNPATHDLRENQLLSNLWPTEHDTWFRSLQPVMLTLDQVLFEPGIGLPYLHFPTTAVVSLRTMLENGTGSEAAVVGRDGMVGVSAFMGGETTLTAAVVLVAGHGFRIATDVLLAEFHRCGVVQHLLLRYTQTLMVQMSQNTVCNRHHSLEQQLCRSLLAKLDRIDTDELVVTQERLAHSLGVRREGVTQALARLQRASLVERRRGRITVTDRPGLLKRACECYGVIKVREDELLADHGEAAVCTVLD